MTSTEVGNRHVVVSNSRSTPGLSFSEGIKTVKKTCSKTHIKTHIKNLLTKTIFKHTTAQKCTGQKIGQKTREMSAKTSGDVGKDRHTREK